MLKDVQRFRRQNWISKYDNKLKDFRKESDNRSRRWVKVNYKKFMDAEIVAKLDIK